VPSENVGVRLIEKIGVGRLFPNASEEIDVAHEAAPAGDYSAIIFDLARDEDVAPSARRPLDDREAVLIFADTGLDDEPTQLTCALEERPIEYTPLEQLFEFTRARWVEIGSEPVDSD
jgi:hypothetical protein